LQKLFFIVLGHRLDHTDRKTSFGVLEWVNADAVRGVIFLFPREKLVCDRMPNARHTLITSDEPFNKVGERGGVRHASVKDLQCGRCLVKCCFCHKVKEEIISRRRILLQSASTIGEYFAEGANSRGGRSIRTEDAGRSRRKPEEYLTTRPELLIL